MAVHTHDVYGVVRTGTKAGSAGRFVGVVGVIFVNEEREKIRRRRVDTKVFFFLTVQIDDDSLTHYHCGHLTQ